MLLAKYAIDELKLVALVASDDGPRALVMDPRGRGTILRRGVFVGRPEQLHVGGTNGADYVVSWRVERIRVDDADGSADVVLALQDDVTSAPPRRRVLSLHAAKQTDEDL